MSRQAPSPNRESEISYLSAEYLAFKLGDEEYGLDVRMLLEVRGINTVMFVANVKDYVKGVINLRGMLVPVVDLRIKLKTGHPAGDQFTAIIILNVEQHVIGVAVDSVSGIIKLRLGQIKQAAFDCTLESKYVLGVGHAEARKLTLVNIKTVLHSAEFGLIGRLA